MIITLHDPAHTHVAGELRLQAELSYAPGTIEPGNNTITYRVRPGSSAVDDVSVLPLVPPALVLACRAGQDLRVTEPLPPAVHEGARHVAGLLHRWYGWRPAELIAPLGADPVRPHWAHRRRGLGVFFTRGVDSWGTLLELLDGPRRARPTHLVTVDNEVHLDQAVRDAQLVETQAVADRLGLPLITVATDIRSTLDPHTDWGTQTHGSVLAGIGLLLRSTLREIVISPTHWTPLLRPWGSHPDLDPAWSLPDLRVTHHNGDEMRWQRISRIVNDPRVADSLLVCWQGSGTRNCGRCEKCLRLMTSLDLLGALDRYESRFDVAFDPTAITTELRVSPHPWCDTIDHLDRVGLRADPLRQRWEGVARHARPWLWFQTRPIQPRIPVEVDPSVPPGRWAEALEATGRRLASLGVRIDHAPGQSGPRRPALAVSSGSGGWQVHLLAEGDPPTSTSTPPPTPETMALAALDLSSLEPLIRAAGRDPADAMAFDPDGQDPPPVEEEPPDWKPGPGDDGLVHQ